MDVPLFNWKVRESAKASGDVADKMLLPGAPISGFRKLLLPFGPRDERSVSDLSKLCRHDSVRFNTHGYYHISNQLSTVSFTNHNSWNSYARCRHH